MNDERRLRSLTEQRLGDLEDGMRSYRRRFRFALAGYAILAVGLCVAFYLAGKALNDLQDTQVATVKLVGREQVFNCLAHNRLRRNLSDAGIVAAPGIKCTAIHHHFKKLEEQARKN